MYECRDLPFINVLTPRPSGTAVDGFPLFTVLCPFCPSHPTTCRSFTTDLGAPFKTVLLTPFLTPLFRPKMAHCKPRAMAWVEDSSTQPKAIWLCAPSGPRTSLDPSATGAPSSSNLNPKESQFCTGSEHTKKGRRFCYPTCFVYAQNAQIFMETSKMHKKHGKLFKSLTRHSSFGGAMSTTGVH